MNSQSKRDCNSNELRLKRRNCKLHENPINSNYVHKRAKHLLSTACRNDRDLDFASRSHFQGSSSNRVGDEFEEAARKGRAAGSIIAGSVFFSFFLFFCRQRKEDTRVTLFFHRGEERGSTEDGAREQRREEMPGEAMLIPSLGVGRLGEVSHLLRFPSSRQHDGHSSVNRWG